MLRPQLTDGERREAIARAFSHHEKPYVFEFDFFSNDRLVCSELVFELLVFLDRDERTRKAFRSSDVGFIGTLKRSRFTFLRRP